VGRVPPHGEVNAITRAVQRLRAADVPYIDLSESNPTRVGLAYPPDILGALADPRALVYEPHPLGLRSAREAVAE
jgi:alanine-synthesizing transaminase